MSTAPLIRAPRYGTMHHPLRASHFASRRASCRGNDGAPFHAEGGDGIHLLKTIEIHWEIIHFLLRRLPSTAGGTYGCAPVDRAPAIAPSSAMRGSDRGTSFAQPVMGRIKGSVQNLWIFGHEYRILLDMEVFPSGYAARCGPQA